MPIDNIEDNEVGSSVRTKLNELIDTVNAFGGGGLPVATTGDPEGVVTAPPRTLAIDVSAKVLYMKLTGTGNTGWQEMVAAP